jgi:basic membrane lipoprotein Med (substrate-binding protein (PBP1-ABC) superfamily)
MLAVMLGVVVLATLLCACGRTSSPVKKQREREGSGQAQTTTPEPSASTHSSRSDSRSTPSEQQAGQSEADCRLVLYVANKNMSPKEAEAFSKLLTEMIRSMEDLSWGEGALRNAALDHLAVPRYRECKHIE